MPETMTVYRFVPEDRSGRVSWLLEELGVPYEAHDLDMEHDENRSEEFLSLNPLGRVPSTASASA